LLRKNREPSLQLFQREADLQFLFILKSFSCSAAQKMLLIYFHEKIFERAKLKTHEMRLRFFLQTQKAKQTKDHG
jgi:hypothetical protein